MRRNKPPLPRLQKINIVDCCIPGLDQHRCFAYCPHMTSCFHNSSDCCPHFGFHCLQKHQHLHCKCFFFPSQLQPVIPVAQFLCCDPKDTCHRWQKSYGRSGKHAWLHSPELASRFHTWYQSDIRGCWRGLRKRSQCERHRIHSEVRAIAGGGTDLEFGWLLV